LVGNANKEGLSFQRGIVDAIRLIESSPPDGIACGGDV